jgi:ABC-type lipoprotein release transport system permease subunit
MPFGDELIQPGRQRSVEQRLQRELPGQPAAIAGEEAPSILAVRIRGTAPAAFADRLREITVSVDPMLRLSGIMTLEESLRENLEVTRVIAFAVMGLTVSVVLLSAAGIYALMSFTITRRRREIGIRSALGAGARDVLRSVLSRAMAQIAIGIGIGLSVTGLLDWAAGGEMLGGRSMLLLPAVAALMVTVGLAAAFGPARRALAIQPTEALRADG